MKKAKEHTDAQLKEKEQLLLSYQQISQKILSYLDRDEILDYLAHQIVQAGFFRSLSMSIVDEKTHLITVVRSALRKGEKIVVVDADHLNISYSLDDRDILAEVTRTGRFEVIEGWDEQRYTSHGEDPARYEGQTSYFIPIKKGEQVLAVFATASQTREQEKILRHIETMQPLLDQVAIALDHAQLYGNLQAEIAERVYREERQIVLHRVRNEVWKMKSSKNMDHVMVEVGKGLQKMGVPFDDCGVNLVDPSSDPPTVSTYNLGKEGDLLYAGVNEIGAGAVLQLWRGKVVAYRRDLSKEDLFGENHYMKEGAGVWARSIVDVPFPHGTLAVNSTLPNAFSPQDIETLQETAQLLSEGFMRMDDLRMLERSNQDLKQEISERQQAEEALQEAHDELEQRVEERTSILHQTQERLAGILDSAHDAIISIDEKERITEFNQGAVRIFGYQIKDVLGKPLSMLIPEEYRAIHHHHIATFSSDLQQARLMGTHQKVFGRRKNGEIFPAESSISKLLQNNQVTYTAILRDITESQQLEKQLRQAQKMEAIGQLTAGIAHNFNNKLMVILNNIEIFMFREQDHSEELQVAEKSTLQAAEMVGQLMMFSRSERTIESEPIQVREVLCDTAEIGRKTFDRKITLVDEIPEDLPLVSGDVNQLSQVFLNLLLNARDAVEEHNATAFSIRIEASSVTIEEEDLPAHLVSRQRHYIRIQIMDNGIGMDEETQQRIFEPFFTTKNVGKGTGLGMATAYAIVNDHQGWIECESQVGMGTTFSVYLPTTEQERVSSQEEQAQAMPRGDETILLIEDEEDLRNQLVSVFKQYGYEVWVGRDGQEGWDLFEREWKRVDVILLDLSLPNVSGQEVLARMLALNPDAKVILSTGYAQHSANALGARALLKKPYRLSQALRTIREVLDE